jgi:Domain of unknown function (DUF4405)
MADSNTRWYPRSLTSLSVMAGFLIMSLSGVVAFVNPQGRIAYWTDWSMLGLTKEQWGDIHILSSLLFVVAGVIHIYYNWRPLMNYLGQKVASGRKHQREIAITILLSLVIVASAIWKIPPLSYLLDLNAYVKELWVAHKDYEPPFGHAELLSLKVFCQKTNIPLEAAVTALKEKRLVGVEPSRPVRDIAHANGTSPMLLYRHLKPLEAQPQPKAVSVVYTAETVEAQFAGAGIGSKTLTDVAAQTGQGVTEIKSRLSKKGMKNRDDQPLKQLASQNNVQPLELLKAALVDAYLPR